MTSPCGAPRTRSTVAALIVGRSWRYAETNMPVPFRSRHTSLDAFSLFGPVHRLTASIYIMLLCYNINKFEAGGRSVGVVLGLVVCGFAWMSGPWASTSAFAQTALPPIVVT